MISGVTKGKQKRPYFVIIYGVEGSGKTGFAASAPEPIFIGTEQGSDQYDVYRFVPAKTHFDLMLQLQRLRTENHEFKSVVLDSADWTEDLVVDEICRRSNVKSIELANGGYGKGWPATTKLWVSDLLPALEGLRSSKGMNIVIICHSKAEKFSDPHHQTEYMRYSLKLYKDTSARLKEAADMVLFLNYETFTKEVGDKSRAFGSAQRIIYTEHRPGFDAKNRYDLPPEISYPKGRGWEVLMSAVSKSTLSADQLLADIEDLKARFDDPELIISVTDTVQKANRNVYTLAEIKSRLSARLKQAENQ